MYSICSATLIRSISLRCGPMMAQRQPTGRTSRCGSMAPPQPGPSASAHSSTVDHSIKHVGAREAGGAPGGAVWRRHHNGRRSFLCASGSDARGNHVEPCSSKFHILSIHTTGRLQRLALTSRFLSECVWRTCAYRELPTPVSDAPRGSALADSARSRRAAAKSRSPATSAAGLALAAAAGVLSRLVLDPRVIAAVKAEGARELQLAPSVLCCILCCVVLCCVVLFCLFCVVLCCLLWFGFSIEIAL